MKKLYTILFLTAFGISPLVNAQTTLFSDDFDSGYTTATDLDGVNGWVVNSGTVKSENDSGQGNGSDWYVITSGGFTVISQTLAVEADQEYIFKSYFYKTGAGNVRLRVASESTGEIIKGKTNGASNVWKSRLVKFTAPASENLTFQVIQNGSGIIKFDDITITCTACATTTTTTWSGASDANFNTAANWSSGVVPGLNDDVIIPSDGVLDISGDHTVKSMSIAAGASIISDGSITGPISYTRSIPTTNWYLISSPVIGQDKDLFVAASNVATGTQALNLGFANYDNIAGAWSYYQSDAKDSGSLTKGQGHAVKLKAAGDVVFTGDFNADDTSIPVTSENNGYNLIGNPYLAPVSVGELLNEANIPDLLSEFTVWVWNPVSLSYLEKNFENDLEIAPGQAFFVKAKTAGDFNIKEDMQSHIPGSGDTFGRTSTKTKIVLNLNNGEVNRLASVFYTEGSTTGFDNGYDSSIFEGVANEFSIYTHTLANSSGRKLGTQSLPNNNFENMTVPLGVIAEAGSNLEFSAKSENLPEGIKVFLEDREENTFTRLDELNAALKITTASAINGVGRFYLHTTQSVLNITDASLDNVSVFKVNNSLRIVGLQQGKAAVKLFNVLGRQVLNAAFESNGTKDISLPSLAKGVYIVQLETAEGKLNKKIILE